jgi:hypothetical protein
MALKLWVVEAEASVEVEVVPELEAMVGVAGIEADCHPTNLRVGKLQNVAEYRHDPHCRW